MSGIGGSTQEKLSCSSQDAVPRLQGPHVAWSGAPFSQAQGAHSIMPPHPSGCMPQASEQMSVAALGAPQSCVPPQPSGCSPQTPMHASTLGVGSHVELISTGRDISSLGACISAEPWSPPSKPPTSLHALRKRSAAIMIL